MLASVMSETPAEPRPVATTAAALPPDAPGGLPHWPNRRMLICAGLALAAAALAAVGYGAAAAAFAVASAAMALLTWLAAREAGRRTERLAAHLNDIALQQQHEQRLPAANAGDIDMATPVNRLLESLEHLDELRREAEREADRRVAEDTRALQIERNDAEAASQAKTRFLANMSHELRTPLNGVIGAAQLLEAGRQGTEEQAHLIEAIRNSGANLLGLIENILDLSRIETGAFSLSAADFNLVDCVETALATTSVGARLKRLDMAGIVDPRLAAWRHGDGLRLRQILLNLLGNAVKFTQFGEVVLTVAPAEDPQRLRISVRDTGIGIEADALAHVFDPFHQADDTVHRRFGGSGLGLAITRQLVEAMGGRIQVHSSPGQGSRFDVELALPLAESPPPEPPPLAQAVLLHEPHEASRQAQTALLERMGCRALPCRDARELRYWVDRLRAEDLPAPWLLVATDAPDAWRFIEESLPWVDADRVIGMTQVESHQADAAQARLRLPRSVVKPVLRSALSARLSEAPVPAGDLARNGPDTAYPATVPATLGPKHVLVVEDDRLNQTIVCSMLHNAGYSTTSAESGAEALAMMAGHAFDLVLMDWQMPDLDGLQVTRRIRAGAAGRYGRIVPIVALTANAFAEDRAACLEAGMNDFLTKPVLAAKLIETVRRWTALPGGDDEAFSSSNFADLY